MNKLNFTREQIEYASKNFSYKYEAAQYLNCSKDTFTNYLKMYNIEFKRSGPYKGTDRPECCHSFITKEWMIEHWVNTSKSMRQLSEEFNISESTLDYRREKYALEKRFCYPFNRNKFFNLETDKAHLKQENFELKESLKVFNRPDVNRVLTLYKVGDIDLLEKKCDRLEQENKKLKEKSKQYREWLDRAESGERDEIDIGNNYRKALEEIRDLINKNDKRNLLNNIENKINEVLSV